MSGQILDSDRRCPRCSKRMILEVGQHDSRGDLEATHHCWSCNFAETDREWSRPNKVARELVAARLARQRLDGWVIPIQYDTTPFPKGEFDEEPADA